MTNVAIVYYSATGSNATIADAIAEGAREAGAEVRVLTVPETAPETAVSSNSAWAEHRRASAEVPIASQDDLRWADAIIFGTPTRFGNVSSQLKSFIDTLGGMWGKGELADKVYSGFTSTGTLHGGQESTLLALYNTIHHFGGILVTPGYTDPIKFQDGNPYGTSHVDGNGSIPVDDVAKNAGRFQGKRVASITAKFAS